MDGLLFDSETLYGEAILTAAAEVGCTMSRDVFLQLIGRSREVNHRFLLEHYGADYPLEALIAAWGRHFRVLAAAGLPLKPGAAELLDLLDELRLPRAIATSSTHATVRGHLVSHGLTDRFHGVVAHGDYAHGKPARSLPQGGRGAGRGACALPGAGGFAQRGAIGIRRRHDDGHGSRSHTADR